MAKQKDNDKVILGLKKEIEIKKALLKKAKVKFSPVTNGMLTFQGTRYNILTVDKDFLLLMICQLESYKTILTTKFPSETLKLDKYPIDSWLEDLYARYNNLNTFVEEERLKVLESKLHNLLSNDTKVDLEIEEIRKSI